MGAVGAVKGLGRASAWQKLQQRQASRRRGSAVMMADNGGLFGGISNWIKKAVDENMYGPEEASREKPKV